MLPDVTPRQFSRGSIFRLLMKDFLTYEKVEIFPGPNLNLLIGANGAGKSTVVCAICLVFGGVPKTLGRSSQMTDYIRHGQLVANVQVEIVDSVVENAKNQVIDLRIRRVGGVDYFLNNKKISRANLLEFLAGYKIQVDNLCQFLAQDKVVQFATQTPQQLLENTEKVAGAHNLFETHEQLKCGVGKKIELTNQLRRHEEKLQRVEAKVEQLKPEVEKALRFKDRQKTLLQLRQKRFWVEFEEERSKFIAKNRVLNETAEIVDSKQHEVDDMEICVRRVQENVDSCNLKFEEKKNSADACKTNVQTCLDRFKDSKDEAVSLQSEISNAAKEYEEKVKNIARVEEIIADLKNQANQADQRDRETDDELKRAHLVIREWDSHLSDLECEKRAKSSKFHDANAEFQVISRELGEIESQQNRKLQALRQLNRDAFQAYMWYEQNKQNFQGEAYMPFLSVNVPVKDHVKFIEACVPRRDWFTFIFEKFDDLQKFLAVVEKEKNFRVGAVCARNFDQSAPAVLHAELKRLGFKDFVSNFFEAPIIVKNYLIELGKMDTILVGGREVNDNLTDVTKIIVERFKFCRTFLTETKKVTIKISQYSRKACYNDSELRAPSVLSGSASDANAADLFLRKEALKITLEQIREESMPIEAEISKIERDKEQLRQKIIGLNQRRNTKATLEHQIRVKETGLASLTSRLSDLPTTKKILNQRLTNCLIEQANFLKTIYKQTQKLTSLTDLQVEPMLEKCAFLIKKKKHENQLRQLMAENSELKENLRLVKRELNQLKINVLDLREKAFDAINQKCPIRLDEDFRLPNQISEIFNALPPSLEEIDESIEDVETRLSTMEGVDNDAVCEYHRLCAEMVAETGRIKNFEDELRLLQENTEEKRDRWLDQLAGLVKSIDANFSKFFEALACAGEVGLDEGVDKTNYAAYGIQIKVKFRRNEPLLPLTHQRQSGGERSVSTMLYLLALQQLSQMPFRCVDEINQGMDAKNERRVFDLMTQLLSGESSSHTNLSHAQYFMLSPKLLPNLKFSHQMKVIFIGKQ